MTGVFLRKDHAETHIHSGEGRHDEMAVGAMYL